MLKILNSVLYVVKLYTLCLTNTQTIERFYTFYSFVFNKKQIIISIDFLLLKYLFTIL